MKNNATTRTIIELPVRLRKRLEELAKSREASSAELALDAISSYVDLQEWQIRCIENGLREADAGELATDEEVAVVFSKWLNAG